MSGKFELYKDKAGEFRFQSESGKFSFSVKAGNNQVIGVSSSYETSDARDSGIASVKASAPEATIDDISGK